MTWSGFAVHLSIPKGLLLLRSNRKSGFSFKTKYDKKQDEKEFLSATIYAFPVF